MYDRVFCNGCKKRCPIDNLQCEWGRKLVMESRDMQQMHGPCHRHERPDFEHEPGECRRHGGPGPENCEHHRHGGPRPEGCMHGDMPGPHEGRCGHDGPHGDCHGHGEGHGPHGGHECRRRHFNPEMYNELSVDEKLEANIAMIFRNRGQGRMFGRRAVLAVLCSKESMSQKELQDILGIQPGSISEILGKLEAAGLITRVTDESDRRRTIVSLTDAGRAEAGSDIDTENPSRFAVLTDEEKSTLLELLEKVSFR